MSDVFHAVADPTRRWILTSLREEGPLSVKALSGPLPMSRQAVTKHLDILEAAGLVGRAMNGRERIHYLRPEPLKEMEGWLWAVHRGMGSTIGTTAGPRGRSG